MRNHKLSFALLSLALVSGKLAASDYGVAVSVDTNAVYDDNFRLTEDDEVLIHGVEATPKLILDASTENSRWNLDTRLRSARYNESDYNTDDQFLSGGYSRQFERSSIGLDADIAHDSTNTSEFASSGRIANKSESHERYALSPSWMYALNENNSLGIDGTYSKDNYEGQNYVGYDYWVANADWNYMFSQRLSFLARLSYSNYTSEDLTADVPYFALVPPFDQDGVAEQTSSTEQTSKSALLGFRYLWTEQQSLTVLIGRSKQNTDYLLEDPEGICDQFYSPACLREDQSGYGLTGDIRWNWKNERNQFDLGLTQSTQPTSDGQAVDQLQLNGSWGYALSELQNFRISVQGYRNRDINDSARAAYLDRNYASALLEYSYRFTENWRMTGSYRYRFQEYTERDNRAHGQVVMLGIRYQPTEWHWSR